MTATIPAAASTSPAAATRRPATDRPAATDRSAAPRVRRDLAIDLVRTASLLVLVTLHALMFGVTMTPGGAVFENALEFESWFPITTWVVQVVPVFFIAGGFASLSAWRAQRAAGGTASGYVAKRLQRLLVPLLVLAATVGVVLAVATGLGLDVELVVQASLRTSQPLWFLAVYVLATSLVPLHAAAYERAPRLSMAVLVAGAIATDVVKGLTGVEAIGAFNFAFVWLAVQQLGFWYLDGTPRRWSREHAGWVAAGAFGGLAVLSATFPVAYPVDLLLAGNNPATVALIVLGVAQLAILRLIHPALQRIVRRRRVARATAWLSPRAMTLYLWHMPVLVIITGLLLATAFWMPAPGTLAWWLTRPVFLATLAVACLPVLALFRRFEAGLPGGTATDPGRLRSTVAALAGCATVVVLLFAGFAPVWAPAVAVALGAGALLLVRETPVRSGRGAPTSRVQSLSPGGRR